MNKKLIFFFISIAVLFLSSSLFFRTSYVSERLKDLVTPYFENAFNRKVTIERLYLNTLPLYVGIDDFKVYNHITSETIHIKKIKAYLSFFDLLSKQIFIKKLILKDPKIFLDQKEFNELVKFFKSHAKDSLDSIKTRTEQPITVRSVEIEKGSLSFSEDQFLISLSNLDAHILLSDNPQLKFFTNKAIFIKRDTFNIDSIVEMNLALKNNVLEVKSLKLALNNSDLTTKGFLDLRDYRGELHSELKILVDSLKKVFGLKNKGEGSILAQGAIKLLDLKGDVNNILLNLSIKGDLYLETLMELLKVKERLMGKANFKGTIHGALNDIRFNAQAQLEKGELFNVKIDKASCDISYEKNRMKFTNGVASLYSGSAIVDVEIALPVVNYFSLDIYAKDVSSKELFGLIQWDPGIAIGKVNGRVKSSGRIFDPHITFFYRNVSSGKNIKERIKEIEGEIISNDRVLTFKELNFSTQHSKLTTSGIVDLNNKRLNFSGQGETKDLKELFHPYFTALSGKGSFDIKLFGDFENPSLYISLSSDEISLHTQNLHLPEIFNSKNITFSNFKADLTYNKNLLSVRTLSSENKATVKTRKISATGNVHFKNVTKLFDFRNPEYDLGIKVINGDLCEISSIFKGLPEFKGYLNTDFFVRGKPISLNFLGNFYIDKFGIKNNNLGDTIEGNFMYKAKEFIISKAHLKRKSSSLSFNGLFSLDKRFKFYAHSKRIRLNDFLIPASEKYRYIPFEIDLDNFVADGEGTFENPNMKVKSGLILKNNNGKTFNNGNLEVNVFQQQADFNISFLGGNIKAKGRLGLTEELPWAVTAEFKPMNYASLFRGILKDAPEDMMLNLSGKIVATGNKKTINGEINLKRFYLSSFGFWLINNSDISLTIKNNLINVDNFIMHGIDTEFSISGSALIGKYYDLLFEGALSITPFKVLFKDIESLRGKTYFVISLTGNWDNPTVDGGIDLTDGSLAFKQIPYKITSVSAYLYVERDRLIFKNLDGKIGGGDISTYGSVYLEGLNIKNFYFFSKLKNINLQPTKDAWINFDGDFHYKGDLNFQELTGDIYIKKSLYSQRFEWKRWLLDLRKKERQRTDASRFGRTTLNVRVKSDNLIIDNNIADASCRMDILLKGTIGDPVILGKIYTDKGKVYFRSNEFKVIKARVDFIDPTQTKPYFDLIAETKVKNYQIKLSLQGGIENFNLSLSSDPILNESDILSLLTLGYLDKQLKGLEGSVGTVEATSFIAGKLQEVLEERIKIITGVDRIQVDPQVSKITGTINPRITILKKILDGKMQIVYSVSTGNNEQQLWKFEYFVDKNISLVGVRDERGGIGGDIKFRFEFR